jgi:hypothetical protein
MFPTNHAKSSVNFRQMSADFSKSFMFKPKFEKGKIFIENFLLPVVKQTTPINFSGLLINSWVTFQLFGIQ